MRTEPARIVTAAMVARCRALADPRWSPAGDRLAWVEAFAGRADLVVAPSDGSGAAAAVTTDVEPAPPCGGFAWAGDGTLVFGAADGRLVAQPAGGGPARILVPDGRCHSPAVGGPGGALVAFVDERDDRCDVAVVPLDGSAGPVRVSTGADYCWDPAWRADGGALAWHEWDLPNMPWDESRIVLRLLDGLQPDRDVRVAAGGDAVATGQPRFSPDSSSLAYTCDRDGWTNVWVARADGGAARPVLAEAAEHAEPTWGPGQRSFAWSPDGGALALVRNEAGAGRLVVVGAAGARPTGAARELGRGWHRGLAWGAAGIAARRSGARTPPEIVRVDPATGAVRVLAGAGVAGWDAASLVEPEPVRWRSGTTTVPGLLYRPPVPAGDTRPPLLVSIHGGPTGDAGADWAPTIQYHLAQGWAVLAPEYRGSTGYGRAHTQALAGGWGEHDVADVVAGIRAAARRGWCDPRRVALRGASAGGLTALLVAARHGDLVRAAAVAFPVTDLLELAATTHRFESRYLDRLVGPLPQAADRYRARSPDAHASEIGVPLLVLQGTDDPVVPPAQVRRFVETVRAAGGSVEYHEYPGERHGWTDPAHVADELERTEAFLRRWVLA